MIGVLQSGCGAMGRAGSKGTMLRYFQMVAACACLFGLAAASSSAVQAQQPIRVQLHAGMQEIVDGAVIACHKPPAPACMKDGTTFVSADRMSSCQFEVKEYVDRTMTYLHCLNDENRKTGDELTRNVDSFNCRLSGGRSCP